LALQRELGLRSQRRAKLGPLGLGRSVADWSDLTGCGKALLVRRPSKFFCVEMIFSQPASHSAHDQYSSTTHGIVPDLKEPIRAEIFGVERLKPHADSLAAAQVVFSEPRLYPLLTPRVLEKGRVLWESERIIAGRFSRRM